MEKENSQKPVNQMALNPIFISVSNLQSRINFSISPAIVSSRLTAAAVKTLKKRSAISRRLGLIGLMGWWARVEAADGLDMKMMAAEQSLEEAEREIGGHAEALLEVKELLERESWKDAQKIMRSSSALLKQDMRTIIMYKPAADRRALRKLYSLLFNNVTWLDYAARDKDAERVWQCYDNIVMALSHILSTL